MNLANVLRYWPTVTNGLPGPYCCNICSCFCSTICNIANCCSRLPEPRPTLIDTSNWLAHVRGSNGTYSPAIRSIRGLSWYLPTRPRIPWNSDLTPVSAKIRAISSNLPVLACVIAATAAAVTLLRMSGFRPCWASDTPVRLACTLSMYSRIGKAWAVTLGTWIGTIALGFFIRITPPGVAFNRSSMFTWPSTAPIRALFVK